MKQLSNKQTIKSIWILIAALNFNFYAVYAQGTLISHESLQIVNPESVPTKITFDLGASLLESTEVTEVKTLLDRDIGSAFKNFKIGLVSEKNLLDGTKGYAADVEFNGIKGITITARLKKNNGKKALQSINLDFPDGAKAGISIIDGILNQDTKLADLIPQSIQDAIPTIKNIGIGMSDDGKKVSALASTIGIGSDTWDLVKVPGFVMRQVQLTVGATDLETPKPTLVVGMAGKSDLGLNGELPMTVTGTLGYSNGEPGEPKTDFTLEGVIENITMENLVNACGSGDLDFVEGILNAMPDPIKTFSINKVSAIINPTGPNVSIFADTDLFDIEMGLGEDDDNKLQYTLGIQFPDMKDINDLIDLPAELLHFKDIDIAAFVSTADGDLVSSLPAFDNDKAFRMVKGLNFIGIWTPDADKRKELGVENINVTAQIPFGDDLNPLAINFKGNLVADIDIGKNFLTLNGGSIEVNVDKEMQDVYFATGGAISVHVADDTKLKFNGTLKVYPIALEAKGELTLSAVNDKGITSRWEKPFGIPVVSFYDLGLSSGGGANFPYLNKLGLRGKMGLGSNLDRQIIGELSADVDGNTPNQLYFHAQVNHISIGALMEAFTETGQFSLANSGYPSEIKNIFGTGLKNAAVTVSTANQVIFGKNVSRKLHIKGDLRIWDLNANMEFLALPGSLKLEGKGTIDPIRIEPNGFPLFKLEGADGHPKPAISFHASPKEFPHFRMNGMLSLLGLVSSETDIDFGKDGMHFKQIGTIAGMQATLDANITNYLKPEELKVHVIGNIKDTNEGGLKTAIMSFIDDRSKDSQKFFTDAKNGVKEIPQELSFIADIANGFLNVASDVEKGVAVVGKDFTNTVLSNAELKNIGFETNYENLKAKATFHADVKLLGNDLNVNVEVPVDLMQAGNDISGLARVLGEGILAELGKVPGAVKDVEKLLTDLGFNIYKVAAAGQAGFTGHWVDRPTAAELAAANAFRFEVNTWYVTRWTVSYPGYHKTWDSSNWYVETIKLPTSARNIKVVAEAIEVPDFVFGGKRRKFFEKTISNPQGGKLFTAKGDLINPYMNQTEPVYDTVDESAWFTAWEQDNFNGPLANIPRLYESIPRYSINPFQDPNNPVRSIIMHHPADRIASYKDGDFKRLDTHLPSITKENTDSLVIFRPIWFNTYVINGGRESIEPRGCIILRDGTIYESHNEWFNKENQGRRRVGSLKYEHPEKGEMELRIINGKFYMAEGGDWDDPDKVESSMTWRFSVGGGENKLTVPYGYFKNNEREDGEYLFAYKDSLNNVQHVKRAFTVYVSTDSEDQEHRRRQTTGFVSSPVKYFHPTNDQFEYTAHDGSAWKVKFEGGIKHTSLEDGFSYYSQYIPYVGKFGNHKLYIGDRKSYIDPMYRKPLGGYQTKTLGYNYDLAFGRSVEMSSIASNSKPAKHTVNGIINEAYFKQSPEPTEIKEDLVSTNKELGAWWEVDLINHYDVRMVTIHTCCEELNKSIKIAVSKQPFTSNDDGQTFASSSSGNNIIRIFTGNQAGRYVRIYSDSDSPVALNLNEVQIFGKPLPQHRQCNIGYETTLLSNIFKLKNYRNGYHGGRFSKGADGNLIWENHAGISWEVKPMYDDIYLDATVGDNYYKEKENGKQFKFILDAANCNFSGFEFLDEQYFFKSSPALMATIWKQLTTSTYRVKDYKDKSHGGSFKTLEKNNLQWTNDKGETWLVKPNLSRNELDVDTASNPYRDIQGGKAFHIIVENGNLKGISYMGNLYMAKY